MKKFLLSALALMNAMAGFAQLTQNGYYRIQNQGSTRYVYVMDNKGSISIGSTTADLGAIDLWTDLDLAIPDPATVLYIKKVSSGEYRFHCQGTNSYEIVGYDLKIRQNRGKDTYRAYQEKEKLVKYLCDAEIGDWEFGKMGTNGDLDKYPKYVNWYIKPIKAQTDHYFGLKPDLEAPSGAQYIPFYAEFPFTFSSPGLKAYYIKHVEQGLAVIEELKGDKVPGGMPVIVKCASDKPAANQLELGQNSVPKPSNNLLKGNYFQNNVRGTHRNVTPYNPETMRMLSLSKDGKLVFKKADLKFLPANRAYLSVEPGTEDEILVVTQAEFDKITAIGDVIVNQAEDQTVYSLAGTVVGHGKQTLKTLPAGVYVIAGKKYIVK